MLSFVNTQLSCPLEFTFFFWRKISIFHNSGIITVYSCKLQTMHQPTGTDQSIFNVVTCLCFCHEWELNRALLWDYRNAIRYSIVGQLAGLNHQTTLNYKLEKPIWFYVMVIWYDSSAIISIFIVLFTNPPILTISSLFQTGPHGSEFLQNP